MKESKIIIRRVVVTILISSVVLMGLLLIVNTLQHDTTGPTQSTVEGTTTSGEQLASVQFTAVPGVSVLDQLIDYNETVEVVQSDMGTYIDSINGLVGGTDGKYWSFYVDDEMAKVGAQQYITSGGEVITWKFQKL